MLSDTSYEPKIRVEDVSYFYGDSAALRNVTLDIAANAITVFFGPAGSGKTTLLRLINRLNDLAEGTRMAGRILLDGRDISAAGVNVARLRRRVGMVFALPLPLPGTIRQNIVYGPRLAGERDQTRLDEIVVRSLTQAALWDEVKDRLDESGLGLSGGQMQRLCIARAIAVEPEIILMDEPCSALDPIATLKIEELIFQLKEKYTIVIVTHNLQQAARVSDKTAFFWLGRLVEFGPTAEMFTAPKDKLTEDYITGRFG
jgi:phosphate transport system ATP-binding protein